jgi:hypothetical protein
MPLKSFLFSFFLVFFGYLEAQVSAFPFEESSLLWKIDGPGVKKGCYLFGTMHLIEKDYFVFPKSLQQIVKKTDVLIMELNGIPKQATIKSALQLQTGSFFDYFTAEQNDSIIRWAVSNLHMDSTNFKTFIAPMKPFVMAQLMAQMQFKKSVESYEMTFENLAKNENIPIVGLETAEEQLKFIDQLPKAIQVSMVMETIRLGDNSHAKLIEFEQTYQSQNIDAIHLLMQDETGFVANEQTTLVDNRNANWIPKIETYMHKNKTFIAVGAGHLGGEKGLIRLLQAKGYRVTPVELTN